MALMREVLIETDLLRRRDNQLRKEAEFVLEIVKILVECPDGGGAVERIVDSARTGLNSTIAILVQSVYPKDVSYRYASNIDACELILDVEFFSCQRFSEPALIYDATRLEMWPKFRKDQTEKYSALVAPIQNARGFATLFLIKEGPSAEFTSSCYRVFKRLVPFLSEAMIRENNAGYQAQLEADLRQKQKLEALGTLAGGMAHEINTPLQYISNNLTFLCESFASLDVIIKQIERNTQNTTNIMLTDLGYEFLSEEIPIIFKEMQEGIVIIQNIINAVKEYSHPGIKEKRYNDINLIINNALKMGSAQWGAQALVRFDQDTSLPRINCFADGIRQVMLNVIINAIHAIEEKGKLDNACKVPGEINITAELCTGFLKISISDNGCGMDEYTKAMIFDPFFTTKNPGEGSGQGLSICHSIIANQHNGRMEVDSALGQGTTLSIFIPHNEYK